MCRYVHTTWWNVRHRTWADDNTDLLRDQCWSSMAPKHSPDWLNPVDYMLFGVSFKRRPINVDDSSQTSSWSSCSIWLAGFWSVASPAWVRRPAASGHTEQFWCKNFENVTVIWTLTETINTLFQLVNFFTMLLQISSCFQWLL